MDALVAGVLACWAGVGGRGGVYALAAGQLPLRAGVGGVGGVHALVACWCPCRTAHGGDRSRVGQALGAAELRLAVARVLGCRISGCCTQVVGVGLALLARVDRVNVVGCGRTGEYQRRREHRGGDQHGGNPPHPVGGRCKGLAAAPGSARPGGQAASEWGWERSRSSHGFGSPIWYAVDNCPYQPRRNPCPRGGDAPAKTRSELGLSAIRGWLGRPRRSSDPPAAAAVVPVSGSAGSRRNRHQRLRGPSSWTAHAAPCFPRSIEHKCAPPRARAMRIVRNG